MTELTGQKTSYPKHYILAAVIALFIFAFYTKAALVHATFGTAAYDLGIFGQNLALLTDEAFNAFNTVRGLPTFGDHFQPIQFLLLPFYWLHPDIHWLLLLQILSVAISAVLLANLAQKIIPNSGFLYLVLSASFLLNPVVHNPLLWHFHPIVLALPLLFLWLGAYQAGRDTTYVLLLGLLFLVREDIVFTTLAFGVVPWVQGRRKLAVFTIASSLGWWLLVTQLAMPYFNGEGYFRDTDHTLFPVLQRILDPGFYYQRLWQASDTHTYLAFIFLPLLCLPLLSPIWALAALPSLFVIILIGGHKTQIIYHYSVYAVPFLYTATLVTLSRYTAERTRCFLAIAMLASSTLAAYHGSALSPSSLGRDIERWHDLGATRAIVARYRNALGPEARIAATDFLLPHFTDRKHLYLFPNPWQIHYWGIAGEKPHNPNNVDYLLLDPKAALDHYHLLRYLTDKKYFKTIERTEHLWILQRVSLEPQDRNSSDTQIAQFSVGKAAHITFGDSRLSPVYGPQDNIEQLLPFLPLDTAAPMTWQSDQHLKSGLIDLDLGALTPGVNRGHRYLYLGINAEKETRLSLLLGSDDTLDVWLNGSHIHHHHHPRIARAAEDRLHMGFRKGINHLYLKVGNLGGDWRLLAEFFPGGFDSPLGSAEAPVQVQKEVTGRHDQGDH